MSDSFRASCSACGVKFQVKDPALIGKRVRCPKCKQPTLIQAPPAAETPVQPSVSSDDPLGLGDLSAFGIGQSGAAPFPTQNAPADPLASDPLAADPFASSPLPSVPFPNAAPSTPNFDHSPFSTPSAQNPRVPHAGVPMTPAAPSFGGAYPTAAGGRSAPQVAAPRPSGDDGASWWDLISTATKIRFAIAIGALFLSGMGGLVLLIGRTPGIGYVGNYAARQEKSLRDLRANFQTDLRGKGPAPDKNAKADLSNLWMYPSNDNMSLKGSLYFPEGDGPFPAIVYCHGGFSLDDQDVDRTNVLLKAGFAVYAPTWRGENGNPGNYELCMGEAADCVAAMEYLARREDIDPESIFLVGHSLGAINAMLAAELSTRPRGVVAIGGMLDMHGLHRFQTTRFIDEIPYDTSDDKEELLRSPAKFLADLSCPMRIVYGDKEFVPVREQGKAIAAASSQLGKKVEYVELPGKDHFSSLVPALGDAAAYFQQLMKQPRQTPAPVFEDRTPEWLAQQIASFPSQVGERRAVVPLLNAAWTAKPDPGPEQDFSPLFELAKEYGIGTPILAGPKQWWSISIDDKAIVIRDLANRTSHRLTGRRTLVDDKSWGGASGFVALSPDGKSLLWLMEGKGDVNNLPK